MRTFESGGSAGHRYGGGDSFTHNYPHPAASSGDNHSQAVAAVLPEQRSLALLDPTSTLAPLNAPLVEVDVVALLLKDKRSPQTRRAYAQDLKDFFGGAPTPPLVHAFLSLPTPRIALALNAYKSRLRDGTANGAEGKGPGTGMAEATINRRLAAIRSLLKFAYRMGLCETDGRSLVDSEKSRAYRDTRGITPDKVRKLLKLPAKQYGAKSVHGLRDTAILLLLCQNVLRRAELVSLNVGDFSAEECALWIVGKGRGSEKERVTLDGATAEAILAYLVAADHAGDKGPLFRNLDRNPATAGGRLTADALYKLVGSYGAHIGVPNLTPHKLRHTGITAYLDATNGDVRGAKRLSRHSKYETLNLYDDNRADLQGKATTLLGGLFR